MAELTRAFEYEIEEISLIPSDGGKYEITVNGDLVYSKLKTNRHAEAGEVLALVRKLI
ncbi:MAG: SelT/SelW/SelH family protein [Anaerolineae bacterium]|jgi:selenoprotein W-related protein|nr:SelT/SelW/SelH family protein [Anaerolineae bacterium]MBT3711838.1 SelT/SelW/SelH family protein [Anaerolineae bacterium]MBT4308786.1 SelT/SelW/SelH family protein [Anaerolineae bacterium]MBT4459993.1 SelT/SelW/SelH family protein [Anaerolineae bacterium]MBT6061958.1 SelT/SelW/SelH family protein [Anaerolineae bacterium]